MSGNHEPPHRAVITGAQLAAGAALTLNIQGDAFHEHTLSLTGAEVTQIAGGMSVSELSSTDVGSNGHGRHNHTVTFN